MRKTEKTESVQFLMRQMDIDYKNAYRIMYLSTGTAAKILQSILPEYLDLKKAKEESQRKP